MNPSERIAELIFRYMQDELSTEEDAELSAWRNLSQQNEQIFLDETNLEKLRNDISEMYENKELIYQRMREKHPELPADYKNAYSGQTKSNVFKSSGNKRISISLILKFAAITIVTAGIGLWLMRSNRIINNARIYNDAKASPIQAGGNHAVLILSNGKSILIDSMKNGLISNEYEISIAKRDSGELVYSIGSQTSNDEAGLNTLQTPRGGQFSVMLSDGTKVWLNAASRLKYPSSFHGNARQVELEGEAYFEVAKNPDAPFSVIVNTMSIQVLGTHFNVMAYADEPIHTTTLLEGSISIQKNADHLLIRPGQQALVSAKGKIELIDDVDVSSVIAWKNGKTSFKDASVQTIMRSISRWYDVDIVYEGNIPDKKFKGGVPRNTELSDLLNVLEQNGIHFRIEGKKLIVTP